jgi:iron(II)-dependent oxidoreductase
MSGRTIIHGMIALLVSWFGTPAMAIDKGVAADHHRKDFAMCGSCHTDRDSLPGVDISKGCIACHKDGIPHEDSNAVSAVAADTASGVADATGGYGMTLPMYYEKSLRGAAPGDMVRIPAGPFLMGSDDRLPDEGPQYTAILPAYDIDRYEVTNLQYKQFIDATGRRSPDHFRNRTFPDGKADHPVTFVSWYDAKAYCEWADERLPTEEEWEKAARGTDGRTFPWGDEFDIRRANTPVRWARLRQEGDTTPVGAFPDGVSPYGLYDMSGNVWEWTASWYRPHPGNTQPSENYGEIYKVLKGGSWWDCSFYQCGISAPVYNRSFFTPRVKNSSFGFRCARDVAVQRVEP